MALSCSVGVLTACGDDDDSSATTTAPAGGGSSVLPPIIADLNSIDGTTVEFKVGGHIDLTGDSTTYKDWTGEISDPKVAEFVAGKDEGGASFNPGIVGLERRRGGGDADQLDEQQDGDVHGQGGVIAAPGGRRDRRA